MYPETFSFVKKGFLLGQKPPGQARYPPQSAEQDQSPHGRQQHLGCLLGQVRHDSDGNDEDENKKSHVRTAFDGSFNS